MQKHTSKLDIFKGNVKHSAEFLFGSLLVFVILIGMGVYLLLNSFEEIGPENTTFFQKSFIGFNYIDDDLVLIPETGRNFVIFDYERYLKNTEQLKKLCDGKTGMDIYARLTTPKHSEDYYHICSLEGGGELFYSFSNAMAFWHSQDQLMLSIIGVFFILFAALFSAAVYVGRNRNKFSQRTYDFFFKPRHGYRR